MKKYKLERAHGLLTRYRIISLIDIPRHYVKKGDKGGYVSSKKVLSHEGDCWIGGLAVAIGNVTISGNALVTDRSTVGAVEEPGNKGYFKESPSIIIDGDVVIRDNVSIFSSEEVAMSIGGITVMSGEIIISNIPIIFDSVINGDGKEPLIIDAQGSIINRIIDSTTTSIRDKKFEHRINHRHSEASPSSRLLLGAGDVPIALPNSQPILKNEGLRDVVTDIEREYRSYANDIVKLIKYPLMTDLNYEPTREFVRALRKTKRALDNNRDDISTMVDDLEDKFLTAESNARRVARSQMTNNHREKINKAEKLITIACNSKSSENEKRISYQQVFKQLEGIVFVSEEAKESLKTMVGVKELQP
jgi:hypothetical protein